MTIEPETDRFGAYFAYDNDECIGEAIKFRTLEGVRWRARRYTDGASAAFYERGPAEAFVRSAPQRQPKEKT